ncbi:MAG TPA: YdcF family protein [Chloroflexota bacterium]|nr:YdcF family protein [Chloroflexota bacterium]
MSVASGPRYRTSRARWGLLAVGLLALALVVTRERWLTAIGSYLVVADPLQPADAVAVLGGGGRARVAESARLVGAGYGHWLVITEMALPGLWTRYSDVVRVEATRAGVPAERILVAAGVVASTYDEALALRQMAAERGWGSLIVVTAPYHTRRAQLTFREVFQGTGVRVALWPASGDSYHAAAWWQDADARHQTCAEYGKLLLHAAGVRPSTREGGSAAPPAATASPPSPAPPAAAAPWLTVRVC